MSISHMRAGLWGAAIALVPLSGGIAHEIVGNRFFPATLTIDDPGVNDELSLPTVDSFKTGDVPPVRQRDISAEFSKRITEDFAISLGSTYSFLSPIDPTLAGANGFQNLETTFKYRLFRDPVHEFVMSVGLSIEWGGTGASNVGGDPFNTSIPGRNSTTTFGVDLDTGDLIADTEFHPRVLNWGATIQYSMPYLKSSVVDLGLPEFINHLIPLVEVNLQTPVANTLTSGTTTTGTINPGVLWVGNKFQVGIEALIPINRQSGTHVGVIGQLHFYLDDIDPRGIGKPIFGGPVQPASPFARN
jgi:hypothetical protein